MLAKREIYDAIEHLPDPVTPEQLVDAVDRLLFVEEVRQGLRDAWEGKVLTSDEVHKALGR